MNSLQIRYFLHLCGTKSISETARQLYVAQPAVSKQIAAMERELGFPLFMRTNRGVELTEGGAEMERCLSEAERSFQEALARVRESMHGTEEQLTIGVLENLGLDELNRVAAGLRQQRGIRIAVARLDNTSLLERLSTGKLDLIITFGHAMEHRTGVQCVELLQEQSYFILSREHPLAQRKTLLPSDLSGQCFCETCSREGDGSDGYLRQLIAQLDIQPGRFCMVDNLASGLAAVESDQAVGLIDERVQLLHPERYLRVPTGICQSVVCAGLSRRRTPLSDEFVTLLRQAF